MINKLNPITEPLPKEGVMEIEIENLNNFYNHPFRVVRDDELMQIVESIKESGVLMPAIARKYQDKTELVSGHRRKLACEILGIKTMPVIIREMSDDEAVIAMVNSNLQRENILPSEKAFAYKMKMDALKHQGKRTDLTSSQLGTKLRTDDLLSLNSDDSRNQIQRYIRLTNLIPRLLEKVDNKEIAFSPAVELSFLSESQQIKLLDSMELNDCTPSHAQAIRLKNLSRDFMLNDDLIDEILSEEKPNQIEQIKIKKQDVEKYFPRSYSSEQIKDDIIKGLELLKKQRDRNRDAR
jgi:ParB family chromosome partitioning protein